LTHKSQRSPKEDDGAGKRKRQKDTSEIWIKKKNAKDRTPGSHSGPGQVP
jgi:hypothetical protein